MKAYPNQTEQVMKQFFNTLSEKDKRRYAAVEAQKLGEGGISYIARVLDCARNTIYQGLRELETLPLDSQLEPRIRRPGGGRKSYEQRLPGIDAVFLEVIQDNIAGDPMDEHLRWTNLSYQQIKQRLAQRQLHVGERVVKQLLKKHNLRRRKAQKNGL